MESNTDGAPDKLTMIWYFKENLDPFIKVEMEQQNQASTVFEEMIQKTINVEGKASLLPSAMVWDVDSHYLRNP